MYRLTDNPLIVFQIETGTYVSAGTYLWDIYQDWIKAGNVPQPVSDESLEELRANKREVINRWRDDEEGKPILFDSLGRSWDGGLRVRARLNPLIALAQPLPPQFFWTDANNNDVPMTMENLIVLNTAHEEAIIKQGFAIHVRQRTMKERLETMSFEELSAFNPSW